MPSYSLLDPPVLAFIVIPILLALALVAGVAVSWRRAGAASGEGARAVLLTAVGAAAWMALTWLVASTGAFRQWNRFPPPLALLLISMVLLAARLAFGGVGRRLATHMPLWALVGVQAFRFPLELAMHGMYERGIMPQQMSFAGRNFDILTGVTAVALAVRLALGRDSRALVLAWNLLGLGLLLNVVGVAILSLPPIAYFGPQRVNTWVAYPPFVWLPAVMVLAALAGHLIVFRALTVRTMRRPEPIARLEL